MKTVAYVVGGCGFLGSRLVDALASNGARVGVMDPSAASTGLVSRDVFHVRDVVSASALSSLRAAIGAATVVFHLGGSGSVGAAERDPAGDRSRTVDSTRALLAETDARVIFVSSAAVYGEGALGLISETHACAPISTYGRHKLEAEQLVRGRSHAIVRFFSLYGPGLRKQLLWDACLKLRRSDSTFAGTGRELRDFLQVDDAVSLLERVAASDDDLVVNGGTGSGSSVEQVLRVVQRALDKSDPLVFSHATRSGDPSSLVADITRARSLGWSPRTALVEGVEAYVRWFELQSC